MSIDLINDKTIKGRTAIDRDDSHQTFTLAYFVLC